MHIARWKSCVFQSLTEGFGKGENEGLLAIGDSQFSQAATQEVIQLTWKRTISLWVIKNWEALLSATAKEGARLSICFVPPLEQPVVRSYFCLA